MKQPPLQALHPEGSLSHTKLLQYSKLSTQDLIDLLQPGQPGALKVRPDGTVIDGHHRLKILYDRQYRRQLREDTDGLRSMNAA